MHQNHPQKQGTGAFRLCCVRDAEYVDLETPSTAVLIDWLISGRIKDWAMLAPEEGTYPRLLLVYQEGYGISLLFMSCRRPMICFSAPIPRSVRQSFEYLSHPRHLSYGQRPYSSRPTPQRRLSNTC
jgi:hypothetical protein